LKYIDKREINKKTLRKKSTKKTDRLVIGAMWAIQCFVYNTNKITE